jgi:hypothetical protein
MPTPSSFTTISELTMNRKTTYIRCSHLLITIFLLWFLTGCGGGGGSSDESPTDETSPAGSGTTTATGAENPITELRITAENDLRVNQSLEIFVEMSSSRSYLSICPGSGTVVNAASMSYDQCIARRPLTAGVDSLSVDVANHTDALVAIIWFYETGRDPLVYRWQRDADKGAPLTAVWRIEEPG